jgi:hypothetical protein
MSQKDVIYIDPEDEITTIIDKVKSSKSKIVALVMPKRSSVLQSTVNMKLLKRASDSSTKQLVLITGESSLLPLAGEIGLPVAKNLQSKPVIPKIDEAAEHEFDELLKVEEPGSGEDEDFDPKDAADKPVGELAEPEKAATGKTPAKPELTPRPIPLASHDDNIDDSIVLGNDEDKAGAQDEEKGANKPKNKKLKIPDFNKFRVRMALGILLLILLIVGWIVANNILPAAKIIVFTNTSKVNVSLPLNLSTTASSVNTSQLVVPAQVQSTSKSVSASAATTGQVNQGNSATGSVTLSACETGIPVGSAQSVPSGIAISSASGVTFITQANTQFSGKGHSCSNGQIGDYFVATQSTPVTAQNPGTSYNIGPTTWTVSGRGDVSGTSTNSMVGGTDNIVQTVSQADINSATQKLAPIDTSAVKATLEAALMGAGSLPMPSTLNAGTPTTSNSANAGAQADTVTVTQTTVYSMLGVQKNSLTSLIDNAVNQQINTANQSIFNSGLTSATYTASNQSATGAQVTLATTATVGPNLNVATLKGRVAGLKAGDVQNLLSGYTGVTKVTVHYSPFWVGSTPKKLNKITITFEKSS